MQDNDRNLKILRDSMDKKERILNNLISMTEQQADYLASDEFEFDVFEDMMNTKDLMIDELNSVDNGFESVYNRVRDELKAHPELYKNEIRDLKNCIREITSLSVELQALEERNKNRLEQFFLSKRGEITGYRRATNKVNAYYQTMTGANSVVDSMMDRKK
ncbi:MAG: hypothetical protein K5656_11535 [Lachnospiraceae bacterium]|nr:hypothetical protein [Lachnospiraceae bacterium]